jgi:hypothetical protein
MSKRLDSGRPRSLPDYDSDSTPISLTINIHPSGALSVIGPIENLEWTIAVLENAKDAVRGYHSKKGNLLIVPPKDVSLK